MRARHLALTLLVAAPAWALTFSEETVTCPIDGTKITYNAMASGTQFGMRLDLKPVGPTGAPPPVPVCPKDHFVVFDEKLDEKTVAKLKAYVVSPEYKAIVQHGPYFRMGAIFAHLDKPPHVVGYAYLRDTWTEGDKKKQRAGFERSLAAYQAAIKASKSEDQDWLTAQIVSGEIERRLGQFAAAKARFETLQKHALVTGEMFPKIVALELELVAKKDTAPHNIPR